MTPRTGIFGLVKSFFAPPRRPTDFDSRHACADALCKERDAEAKTNLAVAEYIANRRDNKHLYDEIKELRLWLARVVYSAGGEVAVSDVTEALVHKSTMLSVRVDKDNRQTVFSCKPFADDTRCGNTVERSGK